MTISWPFTAGADAPSSLRGKTANVVLETGARVVELEEINRSWTGEYLLLWRAPPNYRGDVKPGSRGPIVAWLKRHLALAQGRTSPTEKDPEYDQTLGREIKRFQLSVGLVPDGIVGTLTIMPLSRASDTDDPVLHDGKGSF